MSDPAADLAVRLRGVTKRYGPVTAVDGIDLDIREGELLTLLGPSGSGKTTTLRMVAGFELPSEGTVHLGGVDVTTRPPYERDVNTVFQDYALFPHMSVAGNIGYGLRVRGVPKAERAERVAAALDRLPGVRVLPSDANFLCFETPVDPRVLWRGLLDRGVLVRDVSRYPTLERHLRVTIGTPAEDDAFLTALAEELDR